jgi:hypothetical protein
MIVINWRKKRRQPREIHLETISQMSPLKFLRLLRMNIWILLLMAMLWQSRTSCPNGFDNLDEKEKVTQEVPSKKHKINVPSETLEAPGGGKLDALAEGKAVTDPDTRMLSEVKEDFMSERHMIPDTRFSSRVQD